MRSGKKILMILNLPPPYGGGEIQSKHLFDHLVNNNKYSIIANSRKKSNKSTAGKLLFTNICNGILLIIKASHYIIRYKPSKVYLSVPKQFWPFIKTAIIINVASHFRVRVLGELAGGGFDFLKTDDYRKKIGFKILRKIDDLRVLGNSISKSLSDYGLTKTTVIANGIYVPDQFIVSSERLYDPVLNILYVGALNYSKGIKNLVEAAFLLKSAETIFHLHIMGEWSNIVEKEETIAYIDRCHLNDNITFYGLVTDDSKWDIYRNCQILAHATYWDGQPLVILEAMGCGLVVVSTDIGAIPDTMKNNYNGIILKENNPKELFNSLRYLNDNREILAEMSANNLKTYKEKYTISSFLSRMEGWLES